VFFAHLLKFSHGFSIALAAHNVCLLALHIFNTICTSFLLFFGNTNQSLGSHDDGSREKGNGKSCQLAITTELETRTQRCFSMMLGRVAFGQSPLHAVVMLSKHCASLGFCACSMAANVDKIAKNLLFTRYLSNNNNKYISHIQY